MIIKVEIHDKTNKKRLNEWYLKDKITAIDKRYFVYRYLTDIAEYHDPAEIIIDHNKEELADLDKNFIILECWLEDGEMYKIAFDTIAYIQNDNGKTIEKIVVNH